MDEALRADVPPGAFGAEYTCRDGTAVLLNRALWHVCRHLAVRGDEVRTNTILSTLSRVEAMKPLLQETARYLDGVGAETPCQRDTFLKALKQLKEREVRRRGVEALRRAGAALRSDAPLEITLGTLAADVDALKRAAGDNEAIRPLEDDLADLVQVLFTTRRPVMSTPSAWLNDALGGGWEPGKLYVVCGASDKADNASTDFCAWCAEYAAHRWFPVLYASYRMSREELGVRTLARHGGIEAEAIAKRQWGALSPDEGARLQRRIIETMETLNRRIARTLTIMEADGTTTVAALASAVQTMRAANEDKGKRGSPKPALMAIDSLHLMPTERDGAHTWVSDEASRETLIRLKQIAREGAMAIVVLCAPPRPRTCDPPATGALSAEQIAASFRNSSVVDGVLVVQTDEVTNDASGSETGSTTDQFHRVWNEYRRRFPRNREEVDRRFGEALGDYPPDALTSGYACVSVFNDHAEVPACPLFIYLSPYHQFTPVEIDLSIVGDREGAEDGCAASLTRRPTITSPR
jgi:hypothetical protein